MFMCISYLLFPVQLKLIALPMAFSITVIPLPLDDRMNLGLAYKLWVGRDNMDTSVPPYFVYHSVY